MKKILIVEDDEATAELLEVIVDSAGYKAVSSRAPLPLDELTELNPDLILLDHFITNGRGSEYCREIKANPSTEHIPVLIVSAASGLDKIATDACADGYIEKPFDIGVLEQTIERIVL